MAATGAGMEGVTTIKLDVRAAVMVAISCLLAVSFLAPSSAERPTCMGERATMVGTNGTQRLVGTNGVDVIVARGGSDYVLGKGSADLICAGGGADHVDAGEGQDRVKGGGGNDSLVGGSRTQLLDGGGGDDIFFTRGGEGGTVNGRSGSDWLTFVDSRCQRGAKVDLEEQEARYRNCEGTKTRRWTVRSIENIEGGRGRDVLAGSDFSNRVIGQERADVLEGRDGNDRVLGGQGDDLLRGARGNDRLNGGIDIDRGRGGGGYDTCLEIESRRSC